MATPKVTTAELRANGEEIGLAGTELTDYIQEREREIRKGEREDRKAELEVRKIEVETKRMEMEQEAKKLEQETKRLELEQETKRLELEQETKKLEMEQTARRQEMEHEYRLKELELKTQTKGEIDAAEGSSSSPGATHMTGQGYHAMKFPLAVYDESKEKIFQFLDRFEAMAIAMGLERSRWALKVSQALRGSGYEVYTRLPPGQENQYEELKAALMKHYEVTAQTYRKKFRSSRREPGELFAAYSLRLKSYLQKWMDLAEFKRDYESLEEMMVVDQMRKQMSKPLRTFLGEQGAERIDVVNKLAERFVEVHGETEELSTPTKGQEKPEKKKHKNWEGEKGEPYIKHTEESSEKVKVGNQSTSNSQAKRQWSEKWCSFCRAASHNTKDCRSKPKSSYFAACKVIPTSVITDKAEVGEGERNKKDTGKPRKGTECTHCQSTTHNTVDCRCKGKHANCITNLEESKEEGKETVKEMKDTQDQERPPVVELIEVNGQQVVCLYDTGLDGEAVVDASLVSPDQLTGETIEIQPAMRSAVTMTLPIAKVEIKSRYVTGIIPAAVLSDSLFPMIIGTKYVFWGCPNSKPTREQ